VIRPSRIFPESGFPWKNCLYGEKLEIPADLVTYKLNAVDDNKNCEIYDKNKPIEPANACGMDFPSEKVSSL